LVIHVDEVSGIVCNIALVRDDDGYRLPNITYFLTRQDRVLRDSDPFQFAHGPGLDVVHGISDVLRRQHRHHTRELAGGSRGDRPDACMGIWTAEHRSVQHVWPSQVIDKGPLTGQQPGIFKPLDGLT
jgi:hypothetical protein